MQSTATVRPPFSGHRETPSASAERELPAAMLSFIGGKTAAKKDPEPAPVAKLPDRPAEPVDVATPVDFEWVRWDTGYETGEVSFTADQLNGISALPFDSISITAHRDGTYYVNAIETLNLLEFRGELTVREWQDWLEENQRQVRTFFRESYGASLDLHSVAEPGQLPSPAWSHVCASVGILIAVEQITPIDAVMVALRETAISHLHDDAKTGGLGKLLRDHIASTVVVESENALVLPVHAAGDRDTLRRALLRFVDSEIRERGEERSLRDSVAVTICRTIDERRYPELARFGSIGMGRKDQLLAELARVAAFTRDRLSLRRLEALELYFVRGADNRE